MVEQLNKILAIKADIKSALIEAGLSDVSDKFSTYPGLIKSLDKYASYFEQIADEYIEEEEDGFLIKCEKWKYKYGQNIVKGQVISRDRILTIENLKNIPPAKNGDDMIRIPESLQEELKYNGHIIGIVTGRGYDIYFDDVLVYEKNTVLGAFGFTDNSVSHNIMMSYMNRSNKWIAIGPSDDYGIVLKDPDRDTQETCFHIGISGSYKNNITAVYIDTSDSMYSYFNCDGLNVNTRYVHLKANDETTCLEIQKSSGLEELYLFDNLSNLTKIDFTNDTNLTEIYNITTLPRINYDIHFSPLSYSTAVNLIHNTVEGSLKRTITFHPSTYDSLLEEDIAYATQNNYTIAKS